MISTMQRSSLIQIKSHAVFFNVKGTDKQYNYLYRSYEIKNALIIFVDRICP
jgi:hypothetical protein